MAAADGYARAAQRLGLIQFHGSIGLDNGMGNLYQGFSRPFPAYLNFRDRDIDYVALAHAFGVGT